MQDRLRLLLLLHLHKAGDKAGGVDRELLDKLEALLRDHKVPRPLSCSLTSAAMPP